MQPWTTYPGVDGVAPEDGVGQPDLAPPEVGEDVLRDVGDALAGDESKREDRAYQRLSELGVCSA